jgi:hypothetical protein
MQWNDIIKFLKGKKSTKMTALYPIEHPSEKKDIPRYTKIQ